MENDNVIENNDEVLDFIHRRFPDDCRWLDGNCYYFALILQDRFGGDIYYDVIDGHFACMIAGVLYDWSGIVDDSEDDGHRWIAWDRFYEYDSLQFERIVKDCTM